MKFQKNVLLKNYTTVGIGGPAKLFFKATTVEKLIEAVLLAKQQKLPYLILGEGSNMLVSDKGFPSLVIKNNLQEIIGFKDVIKVGAGTLLAKLVVTTVRQNLSGLQKLAGIPGTVGGAVYGNAGAYGTAIFDHITRVNAFNLDTEKIMNMTQKECLFDYRHSVFSQGNYIILEIHFKLSKLQGESLEAQMKEILKQRAAKNYGEGKNPGSFFKNIIVTDLPTEIIKKIPSDKIIHGKIPAGYLLESMGAKGMKIGDIQVSQNHANLLMNMGNGKAADFMKLARKLQEKVKTKFGITLEPEVQLINLPPL